MDRDKAIELMRSSVNINDWNQKRELVKSQCGGKLTKELSSIIDSSGLIKDVLISIKL